MRVVKQILLVLSGVIAGVTSVISCGDNWHLATDAAIDAPEVTDTPICDCPAAEPPLTGRFAKSGPVHVLEPYTRASTGVQCPVGSQLLSGGCTIVDTTFNDMSLRNFGILEDPTVWWCSYVNNDPVRHHFQVIVLCLAPPP